MERNNSPDSFFLKTHLTVQAAAEVSGYNAQYLRRLLRFGKLEGDKIGQIWLIRKASFDKYLVTPRRGYDQRFGPESNEYFYIYGTLEVSGWLIRCHVYKTAMCIIAGIKIITAAL